TRSKRDWSSDVCSSDLPLYSKRPGIPSFFLFFDGAPEAISQRRGQNAAGIQFCADSAHPRRRKTKRRCRAATFYVCRDGGAALRSEEHTSELQSRFDLV